MPTLIIATHNRHKTEEFAAALGGHFDEVIDLATLAERFGADEAPEPEENALTFEGNARIKAVAAALAARLTKDRALGASGARRRELAAVASRRYADAFARTGGHYSGINAATMTVLALMSTAPMAGVSTKCG